MVPVRFNSSSLPTVLQRLALRPFIQLPLRVTAAPSVTSTEHQHRTQQAHRIFSSSNTMASSVSFLDAVKGRRTIYALNKEAPISDDKIEQLVNETVKNAPSSFNSQSTRLVVLLKDEHDRFWEFVKEVLKPQVPAEQFEGTVKRLDGFKAGYGTILFFEDPEPIQKLQKAYAIYADYMPQWSEHTSAIHQYILWAGLEAEGFGANLQHVSLISAERPASSRV